MRWAASLALAFAVSSSACAQEKQYEVEAETLKVEVQELQKDLAVPERPVSENPIPEIKLRDKNNIKDNAIVYPEDSNELIITAQKRPPIIKSESQKRFEEYRRGVDTLMGLKPVSVRASGLAAANAAMAKVDRDHAEYGDFGAPKCYGDAVQGGLVICRFKGQYEIDGYKLYSTGPTFQTAFIGLNRNAPATQKVKIWYARLHGPPVPVPFTIEFDVAPRDWDISRIDGLPPSQVSTFTPAQLKRIRSSSARKKVGFSSRAKEMGFKNGFISPIKEYRKTTNFGAQRILNGEPKKPHYGVDMAAPVGTPIYAPADGVVSLADDDLYFEGAMVLLDHGQGLISMYLHTDSILVEPGQKVKQGEQIATVGSKGRSTGPHLCWRLKWRNRNLDPELLTEWPQGG